MTFTNDIALVKLNRKVRFSDKVQPIKLPKGGLSYQGYQAYVSGWGIQGPYEGPSSRLKGAELVVSIILCLHVILSKFFLLMFVDPTNVCTIWMPKLSLNE